MGNSYGKNLVISIYGESHGDSIGVMIDGLPAGITLDFEKINHDLTRRKQKNPYTTARVEKDDFNILSGYFNNYTTGTPLVINLKNTNVQSKDYDQYIMRPSHSDYPMYKKHRGFNDYRGGGQSSARITAALVVAGSICESLLNKRNIYIGSHIKQIHEFKDEDFGLNIDNNLLNKLNNETFPIINNLLLSDITNYLDKIKDTNDSIGGIIQSAIINVPVGLGEPYFDSIESKISQILFSIPSIKGVSFGEGFDFVNLVGSTANDLMKYEGDEIHFQSNNNGGVLGGVATGCPIIVNSVLKPIPSIQKPQETIDILNKSNLEYTIQGRHDVSQLSRAVVIINAALAIALTDLLIDMEGKQWMI